MSDPLAWASARVPGARWELVRERPWATVWRSGDVWLKAAGPATRFEAALYGVLAEVAPDRILVPLALDVERGWMLLPEGGPSLRETGGDLALALRAYAELQLALAPHVGGLLAAGVADMRPERMPERFDAAVARLPELGALRADYTDWCAALSASPVPASVDHNDLHAQNVLAGARLYDWGDAVVAHPFASLLVVRQTAGADFPRLRDAYLEPFTALAQFTELRATAEVACRVGLVARAWVWQRASADDPRWADAATETLRALLP